MKAMTAIGPWHPSTGSGQAWDTSGDRFHWNMGTHGGEPLDGVEGLLILSILRTVEDLGLFRDISKGFWDFLRVRQS
jgi:hypothetical protein